MTNQMEYFRPTPPPKKKSKMPLIILAGFLLLLLIFIIILLITREMWLPLVDGGKSKTQTANTQMAFSTTLEQLNLQQYQIFTKTSEGMVKATQAYKATQLIDQANTKVAQKTLAFQETATQAAIVTATQQYLSNLSDQINQIESNPPLFGPKTTSLLMDNSGFIQDVQANVKLKNFIAQADFYVPYSSEEGSWDIGFFFRNFENGSDYRLVVTSQGMYYLMTILQNNQAGMYISSVNNLNLEKDQANQILLYVQDSDGYFIVNDQLIERLDLSQITQAGDIYAFSGAFNENIIVGKSVKLENFTVWAVP